MDLFFRLINLLNELQIHYVVYEDMGIEVFGPVPHIILTLLNQWHAINDHFNIVLVAWNSVRAR